MGRGSNILLLAISIAFTGMGAFLIQVAENDVDRRTAICATLFFGSCLLVAIAQFLAPNVQPADLTAERVVFRARRLYPLLMGVAPALWGAAGYMGTHGDLFPVWLAWALLLFGAIGTIVILPRAFEAGGWIEIDREGFWDHRVTRAKVRWSDVGSLAHGWERGRGKVNVWLNDVAPYLRHRRRRFLFFKTSLDPIRIRPLGLQRDIVAISNAIFTLGPDRLRITADYETDARDDDW